MINHKKSFVFVGCYTEDILFGTGKVFPGKGEGISSFLFDQSSGALEHVATQQNVRNPSFIIQHPFKPILYAVNEMKDFGGEYSGALSAFHIDQNTGELTFINQVSSLGADPCHLAVDKSGQFIIVANFANGSVGVGKINVDGSICELHQRLDHTGSSIDPIRQTSAHAHAINFSPCGTYIYVPDLGLDEIIAYKLNSNGFLEQVNSFSTPAGGGPRGLVFHPNLNIAYVVNELASTVATLLYTPTTGEFELLEVTTALALANPTDNTSSEIQISHNGHHLYISNRGQDNIAIFDINQDTGRIKLREHTPTKGKTPRHFAIDKSDHWIAICNQESDNIILKNSADPSNQPFTSTHALSPTCILFMLDTH